MQKYGEGTWAPSLRFHDGKFWIYVCTPHEGLFMTTASTPQGPWAPMVCVKSVDGWEDPCPFWDEDGQAYLGHSVLGAGPIFMHRMSADGTQLLDEGTVVYRGPVAEGTKIYKRNGWYYLIIPEGGVGTGWQTALRAKEIYGPYEKRIVLEQGTTTINGPHQGGLVELKSGESWFIHFQDKPALGRVTHLQPVRWADDWPMMGIDLDQNGVGEPVEVYKKPDVGNVFSMNAPQTSDDFSSPQLGLQWQWNHNPVNGMWSLEKQKGCLMLSAMKADQFSTARNTLTQKLMGESGYAITEMSVKNIAEGQKAGICFIGKANYLIGVKRKNGELMIFADFNGREVESSKVTQEKVWLQCKVDVANKSNILYYSFDGKNYLFIGGNCDLQNGYWKGSKIGLFSYNTIKDEGIATFSWFKYFFDGPLGQCIRIRE